MPKINEKFIQDRTLARMLLDVLNDEKLEARQEEVLKIPIWFLREILRKADYDADGNYGPPGNDPTDEGYECYLIEERFKEIIKNG